MQQKDYLLRQIEMMTIAITELIRKLLGMKSGIDEEEAEQVTNETLKEQLDISLDDIADTPVDEVVQFLLENGKLHESNLELFVELITVYAEMTHDEEKRTALLNRALFLINWYDEKSNVYSFQRIEMIQRINNLLLS